MWCGKELAANSHSPWKQAFLDTRINIIMLFIIKFYLFSIKKRMTREIKYMNLK